METIMVDASQVVTTSSGEIVEQGSPHVVQVSIPNQPVQVTPIDDDDDPERKRREILARRPSYRRILNELSSDPPIGTISTPKIEEESNSSQTSQDSQETSEAAATTHLSQVVPAQTIQLTGDGVSSGLQTLTMTNAQQQQAGATIVQYAQGPDGQFFIPVSNISAGSVQAYQITTPTQTSLPQGVVMATAGTTLSPSQAQLSEEHSRKRELRLLKNREAAKECRRKKKDYVKCLENRVAVLENQNKALIEELKTLKELYCQQEHLES